MRTTAKPVIDALRAHILEQFEETAKYEDAHVWPAKVTPLDCLTSQIDYMRYHERTTYQTALDWAEGGSALIYHTEVKEFLNSLGINETNKRFDDDKSWKLYCHLVAREITKLYEGAK